MTKHEAKSLLESVGCVNVEVVEGRTAAIMATISPGVFVTVRQHNVERALDVIGVITNALRSDTRIGQ